MDKGIMQKALEWGAKLAAEIAKDLEDSEIDFMEGLGFWNNALGLIPIIKDIGGFPEDWERLKNSPEYMNQITKGVSRELSIDNQEAKSVVVQGIRAGLETAKFVNMIVDIAKRNKK